MRFLSSGCTDSRKHNRAAFDPNADFEGSKILNAANQPEGTRLQFQSFVCASLCVSEVQNSGFAAAYTSKIVFWREKSQSAQEEP